MRFKIEIANAISNLMKTSSEEVLHLLGAPPSLEQGEYTFPCFSLSKKLGKKPTDIASELSQKISLPFIREIKAVGPYLNFFIDPLSYQKEILTTILREKGDFGKERIGQQKKVLIEYSSPNIAKPFHVGHFRATLIGNSLKRLFQFCDYDVVGINYLGDWGTQFGKLITAFQKWGDKKHLEKDPIPYLNSLYVKFHKESDTDESLIEDARAWFKKCEEGDPTALKLWKTFKELSLKAFQKIYDQLNVEFDEVSGESLYNKALPETIQKLKSLPQARESEGAWIVDLEILKLPPALFLRKDGASLYLTRDVAALLDRFKRYQFEKMIYVVGEPQTLHFEQLFSIMSLFKFPWASRCHHVSFGQIRLKDQKMSTRQGAVILLEDLLTRAEELISGIIENKNPALKGKQDVAQKVALGAIIFADFGSRRTKNVTFDWDQILNPDGDTGPYVLYTYARAGSILRKAPKTKPESLEALETPEERDLIRHLEQFPWIIRGALEQLEPSTVATYLLQLSKKFNRFYHEHRVIQSDHALQSTRLALVNATRQVLGNGLWLLGVTPVEEL